MVTMVGLYYILWMSGEQSKSVPDALTNHSLPNNGLTQINIISMSYSMCTAKLNNTACEY